jgi:hypothetical protein
MSPGTGAIAANDIRTHRLANTVRRQMAMGSLPDSGKPAGRDLVSGPVCRPFRAKRTSDRGLSERCAGQAWFRRNRFHDFAKPSRNQSRVSRCMWTLGMEVAMNVLFANVLMREAAKAKV